MHILFLITLVGMVFGSFVSALSWRIPNGKSIKDGRSICSHCKNKISWYDNIPLLSFLVLRGKCRNCNNKISIRYPLIEFFTGFTFLSIGWVYFNCQNLLVSSSPICMMSQNYGFLSLIVILIISVILITIFVIDWENQIIPDELVFVLLLISVSVVMVANLPFWERMIAGFSAGMFLLSLNLLTSGKGMGLGDGKLAIPIGIFFGLKLTVIWIFLSFLIGAAIGLLLIAINKARFGKQIAFGPFLVISFFVLLILGDILENYIFLY